jgi:hypothetical protein
MSLQGAGHILVTGFHLQQISHFPSGLVYSAQPMVRGGNVSNRDAILQYRSGVLHPNELISWTYVPFEIDGVQRKCVRITPSNSTKQRISIGNMLTFEHRRRYTSG